MPNASPMARRKPWHLIRDLVWQAEDNDFDSQLQAERFAQRTAGRQPDFKEGVKAFLEKRPANFRHS